MQSGGRRLGVRLLVALFVASVATFLVYVHAVDPSRLVSAFHGIGALAIATGVVGAIGVAALQSLRWWVVTRPILGIRYRDAFAAVLVGGFFNAVLPVRAGDAFRIDDLSRRSHASRATLLGTELIDFVMDKAGWLPAFAILIFTGRPPIWMDRAFAAMACIVLAAALIGATSRGFFRRVARERRGWMGHLAEGLMASSPRRLALAAVTIAACPWLWEALVVWGFARMGGLELGALQAFTVLTAFNVAAVVPAPGNFGVHEAASSATLVSFGVPLDRALALAVAYHVTQLIPCVLGGSLVFLSRRFIASRLPSPARPPRAHE